MATYRFTQDYRSSYGAGAKDAEVELSDDVAAAINRDAPGTLEPVSAQAKTNDEDRAVEHAPHDRQVKRPKRTRGAKA